MSSKFNNQVFFTMDLDVAKQTMRLKKISKNAFPYAVKQTLNEAAFDTRRGIIKRAKGLFHIRTGNKGKGGIFNLITPVKRTKFNRNVSRQTAYAGIAAYNRKKTDIPAKRMVAQEEGTGLETEKFILSSARVGKTMERRVGRKSIKGKALKDFSKSDLNNSRYVSKLRLMSGKKWSIEKQFAVALYWANRRGKILRYKGQNNKWLYSTPKYKKKFVKRKNRRFEMTKVFSLKKGRHTKTQKTKFVYNSARAATKGMSSTFHQEFRKRIAKIK